MFGKSSFFSNVLYPVSGTIIGKQTKNTCKSEKYLAESQVPSIGYFLAPRFYEIILFFFYGNKIALQMFLIFSYENDQCFMLLKQKWIKYGTGKITPLALSMEQHFLNLVFLIKYIIEEHQEGMIFLTPDICY